MKTKLLSIQSIILGFTISLLSLNSQAQQSGLGLAPGSPDTTDLMNFSLEDLMSIKVVSASRKEESIFNAPITSFVITAQDVFKSGATSIPEALKLAPGLIVRENTPGSYDVSIRGISSAPFQYQICTNRTILVMIDYRSVYNNLDGGTIWSNLPIDLSDVDRIEIVEGPVASLYGPNAATGIINIITKKVVQKNVARAITQHGLGISNNSLYLGHQINDKLSVSLSGNYSSRLRTTEDYFDVGNKNGKPQNKYITNEDSLAENNAIKFSDSKIQDFYDGKKSIEKYGANLLIDYKLNEKTELTIRGGLSNGSEYKPTFTTTTNLLHQILNTQYAQLSAHNDKFTAYVNYTGGTYNYGVGLNTFKFDQRVIDAYFHYDIKINDQLSIVPAISTQTSYVDGADYSYQSASLGNLVFIQNSTINNFAPSLRINFSPIHKLKLIGSIRADKFTKNDKILPNYAIVANYLISENSILRINFSNAYMGQFHQRVDGHNIVGYSPLPGGKSLYITINPQENLLNSNYQTLDLGFRNKIGRAASFDISVYYNKSTNQSVPLSLYDTVANVSATSFYRRQQFKNLSSLFIEQYGAQISFNIALLNNKLIVKPYLAYQTSTYHNVPVAFFVPDFKPVLGVTGGASVPYNINNTITFKDVMDPNFYGGLVIDYSITSKLNLNFNTYYYEGYKVYNMINRPTNQEIAVVDGKTTLVDFNNPNYAAGQNNPWTIRKAGSEVATKIIFNAKIDYKIAKGLSAFINARNLTNNKAREYQYTDQIGGFYLLGLSYIY